ncbi:hypothetical protein FHW89_004127 [Mucilaginibacter sp. SG564]|nr:hypothetical protein [Mucilaginibacter sp. SG564]
MSFRTSMLGKNSGARRNYLLSDSEKSYTLSITEYLLLEDFSSPPMLNSLVVRSK